MTIEEIAEEVHRIAQEVGSGHDMAVATLVVAPDGAFQIRAPGMNVNVIVGVLMRAATLLTVSSATAYAPPAVVRLES